MPGLSCDCLHISLLHRIASPPSIARMNPTQYVLIIVATTSKICARGPSTRRRRRASLQPPCQSTTLQVSHCTSPPSILVYPKFDRYVITRFLAGSDFHGHRPTVLTWSSTLLLVVHLVAYPASSFFASCRSCLPQSAHWSRTLRHTHEPCVFDTFGVC